MLFNTFQFAIFFALVLALYRALPRASRGSLLLCASLLFYALWVPAYLLLMLAAIGVNYLLMRAMVRSARPRRFLAASIVFTLGLLAGFKYAALVVETALPWLPAGFDVPVPDVFLPLGISFYSFQIIGLMVDTHRGAVPPVASLSRFALFVSFFPQLIVPQLERGGVVDPERSRRGLWLIACGLVKKVVLADFLLAPFVDEMFADPGLASRPFHWVALYGFAFQIYFDFSGYTDMARGLALLLGFELPLNFREPYLSRSPAEFWRRWHITLSSWLRDYLYIPLGGNRAGAVRTQLNLVVTMLLGGLWHGAAWNFLWWGALHGALLVGHRIVARGRADADAALRLRDLPRVALCFHAMVLPWVFFRAPDLAGAGAFFAGLFVGGDHGGWPVAQTAVVALCLALHPAERLAREHLPAAQRWIASRPAGAAIEGLAIGVIVGLVIAVSGTGGEFIYFQF